MIEVKVGLGVFEVSLEQLMSIAQGQHYQFSVSSGQILDLSVGEEKIAEAKLISNQDGYCLEITKMIFREEK